MTDEKTETEGKADEQPETRLSGHSVEAIADALHDKQKKERDEGKSGTDNTVTDNGTGSGRSSEREASVSLTGSDHKAIAEQIHGLQVAEQEKKDKEKEEKEKDEKPEPQTKPNPVHFLSKPLFRIGGKRANSN